MNKEIKFKSLNELYKRLYPALNTRKEEMVKQKIEVTEFDIWQLLKENKWDGKEKLNLCDMVSDIMQLKEEDIIKYLRKKKV